jgi:hypothetical protein
MLLLKILLSHIKVNAWRKIMIRVAFAMMKRGDA